MEGFDTNNKKKYSAEEHSEINLKLPKAKY